jgi:hypothetical protein
MAFPTNPTNGQLANVNGITYTYSTTTAAWQVTSSFPQSSNTTVASLIATGNITGSYILGNGSQLTGLPATYGNSNVVTLLAGFGSNTISTTGTITSGNVTGGNVLTVGLVSATGNITTAGNFVGNGSQLTGLPASGISQAKVTALVMTLGF